MLSLLEHLRDLDLVPVLLPVVHEWPRDLETQLVELGEIAGFHTTERVESVLWFQPSLACGACKGLSLIQLYANTSNNRLPDLLLEGFSVPPQLDDISLDFFLGFLSKVSSLSLLFLL